MWTAHIYWVNKVMRKKNAYIWTIGVGAIVYITLILLIEDFQRSKYFYPSLIVMWVMAFVVNLIFVKSDNDEHRNIKKTMSKKTKKTVISIIVILVVAIIWILGVVDL